MKATGKWLAVLAMLVVANGQAIADAGKVDAGAPVARTAAWERVGDAGQAARASTSTRMLAPGEGASSARKAEMVRRMFWIMLAHR